MTPRLHREEQWHLDKRVPLALILTILIQSAAAIWWAAGISERMNGFQRQSEAILARNKMADEVLSAQAQRTAVLAEAIANTNRSVERLQGELSATNNLLRDFLLKHNEDSHIGNGGVRR